MIKELKYRFPQLTKIFTDGGYRGELIENVRRREISMRSDKATGFEVLPMRWIVERSFSWFENSRRHTKDYKHNPRTSETMIHLAFIILMLNRIKKQLNSNRF